MNDVANKRWASRTTGVSLFYRPALQTLSPAAASGFDVRWRWRSWCFAEDRVERGFVNQEAKRRGRKKKKKRKRRAHLDIASLSPVRTSSSIELKKGSSLLDVSQSALRRSGARFANLFSLYLLQSLIKRKLNQPESVWPLISSRAQLPRNLKCEYHVSSTYLLFPYI